MLKTYILDYSHYNLLPGSSQPYYTADWVTIILSINIELFKVGLLACAKYLLFLAKPIKQQNTENHP